MKAHTLRSSVSSRAGFARLLLWAAVLAVGGEAQAQATHEQHDDPRVGLRAGWQDAESVAHNLELVAHVPRPEGFFKPNDPGNFSYMNARSAFM